MSGDNTTPTQSESLGPRSTSQFALEEIVRPLAIAGMMTCIASAVAYFVTNILGVWPGNFFIILVFIISLESIHSQRLLNRREATRNDVIRFRFVEWVVILLVIRFGVYLRYGGQQLLRDMALWGTDINAFFSADFMMNSLLVLIFWALALSLSKTVQELESTPFEKPPVVTDPDFYLRTTIPQHGRVDRRSLTNRIALVFFIGGVVMLILAGLAQMDIRNLVVTTNPTTGVVLNIMLYYLIGLLLLSQVQYTTLKANWEVQGIAVGHSLGRRWLLFLVLFLLLVGIISALLPVSYSVGVVAIISTVVRWIAYAVLQLVYFIIVAVTYLFMAIGSLFSQKPIESAVLPTPNPTPEPPPNIVAGLPPATWWQVARSFLFWGVLIGVSAYAILRFLNDRWGLLSHLKDLRLIKWLRSLFGGLGKRTAQLWHTIISTMQRQIAARQNAARRKSRMRAASWRKMSARERVRFLYLALLQSAADQGLDRPVSATPLEYASDLNTQIPEESTDTQQLTLSFDEARYSEHAIDDSIVEETQQHWRNVKRALNERKRQQARKAQSRKVDQSGQG
ncbi:MAG: DUF4129 domain-containing protein [Anaerolineae bacterium]